MGIYIICFLVLISILSVLEWGFSFSTIFIIVSSCIIGLCFLLKRISNKHKYINIFYKIYKTLTLIFISTFILVELFILVNISFTNNLDKGENVDTMIVLGARVNGYEVSNTLKNRLDKAIEYYNKNKDINIIVSGGQGNGENISEAMAMKNYLISKDVKENKIILEDKATTTLENITFSKNILKEMGKEKDKVLIVTNDYHLFRARTISSILGLKNEGLCCQSSLSGRIYYMIREYPTMVIDLYRSITVNK